MKKNYAYMASKELKHLFKQMEDYWGKLPALFKTHALIKGKEKIYLIHRDIEHVNLENIRINNMGLYIAEVKKEQLRLSIEGSQLIGPVATKNVYELNDDELKQWFKGGDLTVEGPYEGFVILKHGTDYVGSGKFKEGSILNFVPKARRIHEMH